MKFLTLLLFTACISDAGLSVVQKKNEDAKPLGEYPDILYIRTVWNNVNATNKEHDKTWARAKEMCEGKGVVPINDEWLSGNKEKIVRVSKFIVFEFFCRQ